MDKTEFDEMITTLTEFVEATRRDPQAKQFTGDDVARFFVAVTRATRPGFESLRPLLETVQRGSYDEALKILETVKTTHRPK